MFTGGLSVPVIDPAAVSIVSWSYQLNVIEVDEGKEIGSHTYSDVLTAPPHAPAQRSPIYRKEVPEEPSIGST
ncbi:hypothetical protein D3C78_730250 [compost metagenome]